ncbi:hypothetical protein LJC03_05730, partial [Methanobrevibacter sp. OttesenSCG-928-I08]|nr:hypothetical protein [Methanobrevibacter sp. OttesenSCG-928-I08]
KPDEELNSELFTDYVEPFLESITLKEPSNPPKENQFYNLTESEFDLLKNYIETNGWSILDRI